MDHDENVHHRYAIASFVFALAIVAVSFVGLLGNSLSFYIFTQREMRRTSINVLLSGLAIFDGLVCLLGAPAFATLSICALLPNDATCDHATIVIVIVVYPFAMMAQTSSIWCLIVITVERFIAVCFPLQTRRWCTPTRSKFALVSIAIFSCLYNFVRFFEYTSASSGAPGPRFVGWLRDDKVYAKFYLLWLNFATHFIVPMVLLLSLNSLIVCSLRRKLYISLHLRHYSTKKRHRSRTAPVQLTLWRPNDNSTTWMMICVTCLFILCNVSSFCLNAVEALGYLEQIDPELFAVISDANNLLVEINSAANCFIYFKFSGRYRHQCASLISRKSEENTSFKLLSVPPSPRAKKEPPAPTPCSNNEDEQQGEVYHTWIVFPSVRLTAYAPEVML